METLDGSSRHPNWRLAESILATVIPGATGFDPDQIPGLQPGVWQDFDIDSRDPELVANALLDYCRPLVEGLVIVVTDDSFRKGVGPFFVSSARLSEFALSYPDVMRDVFVSGDVVVVSPSNGHVVVVHHNGLIATLSGAACPDLLDRR